MKITEIKIGNLVYDTKGEVNSVCVETFIKFNYQITPIPLTEEWLLKFGFSCVCKVNNHYSIAQPNGYKDIYKIHVFNTINDKWHIAFSDNIRGIDNTYVTCTSFEYVHQLQNLYFALTGEELTTS